jgi:hypothetical protein
MPARNRYHRQVVRALEKDGWTITRDPFHLAWGGRDLYVDLAAEKLIAAEKGERRIAVEIQSFFGESEMEDLQHALGQFTLYKDILERLEPDRTLYMAVVNEIYLDVFEEPIGQLLLTNQRVRLLVFDPWDEEIKRWIP